jgi:fructose-bisphosphate aldolase class 1
MNLSELNKVAEAMVAPGRGILAADESTGTIKKRFDTLGVESTADSRRDYREMLFRSADAMSKYISGVILYDETIRQNAKLYYQRVALEGMVLKPNMIVPGKKSAKRASVEEVAEKTLKVLKACVPASVPGIAFLSGGQSDEDATAHLDAMNKMGPLPWRLSFSYGRALQASPQKTWSGKSENVAAAQRAFGHRAMMNGLASLGQWKADLERKAA